MEIIELDDQQIGMVSGGADNYGEYLAGKTGYEIMEFMAPHLLACQGAGAAHPMLGTICLSSTVSARLLPDFIGWLKGE